MHRGVTAADTRRSPKIRSIYYILGIKLKEPILTHDQESIVSEP